MLGRDWLLSWLMVGPVVLIVLALLIYPFVDAILLSFQDRFIGKAGTWIGLDNYAAFFNGVDKGSARRPGHVRLHRRAPSPASSSSAWRWPSVLNQDIPMRNIFRGIMFLPWAVPAVVSAYVWRFLFDTTGRSTA